MTLLNTSDMFRRVVLSAVALLAFVAIPRTSAQQSDTAAALGARIGTALERHQIPGAVAIAVTKSRTVYKAAFGVSDISTRRPMTADAIFRIASMTKPVTSVAALQLIERGRISLDAPVSKYLPELSGLSVFESFDSASGAYSVRPVRRPITLRQLLTHTSGLGYNFTSATVRDFKPRDGERYPAGPLLFEPGERWHYGTSTDWVGRLVERISGQKLDAYFADHVFRPLRMRDTFFNVPADKQARLVSIHRKQTDGTFVVQAQAQTGPVTEFNGGGGLFSTGDDYARFLRMLLNHGELDGARVLSSASVAMMSRDQLGGKGVPALRTAMPERSADFTFVNDGRDGFGLGFLISAAAVPGKRSIGSLSWGGINNTLFWLDPRREVGGILLMQFLPFVDPAALDVLDAFERGIYELTPGS
jgi:CubicO group peptidase (beta-lactamase class C family)